MNTITRDVMIQLRKDISEAIQLLPDKHGLSVQLGAARFNPTTATIKVEVAVKTAEGEAVTKEYNDWKMLACQYGLKTDLLGTVVKWNGEDYKILGLLKKSLRFPILARRVRDSKQFKLPMAWEFRCHTKNTPS